MVVSGNELRFRNKTYRCAIGRAGCSRDKHEGDGKTPVGRFHLRECWYRADRLEKPVTGLPVKAIGEDDGWCDDPKSPYYNQHVKLPCGDSHEALWRDDHRYDLLVPIGYNDHPVISERGSAIFIHVAEEDYAPTAGCVALNRKDLLALLPQWSAGTVIEIA